MRCACIAWEVRERRSRLATNERTCTALTSHRRKSGDGPLLSRFAGERRKRQPVAAGSETRNSAPGPSLAASAIVPPCASTIVRQIERPMPMPLAFVV